MIIPKEILTFVDSFKMNPEDIDFNHILNRLNPNNNRLGADETIACRIVGLLLGKIGDTFEEKYDSNNNNAKNNISAYNSRRNTTSSKHIGSDC